MAMETFILGFRLGMRIASEVPNKGGGNLTLTQGEGGSHRGKNTLTAKIIFATGERYKGRKKIRRTGRNPSCPALWAPCEPSTAKCVSFALSGEGRDMKLVPTRGMVWVRGP